MKISFLGLVALGLLLIPCLAQASGIDPDNSIEITTDNIIRISADSGDYTSTSTSEDGDDGTPVVTSIDPPPSVDPPPDPRPDDPPSLSAPTGLRIVVDGVGGGSGVGSQATLAWDANPESYLVGYKVYWGINSGSYENMTDAGNVTTYTLSGLPQDVIYSAVTAYGIEGQESGFSEELVINNVPLPPTVILLGTGLLGLGLLGRRRRQS